MVSCIYLIHDEIIDNPEFDDKFYTSLHNSFLSLNNTVKSAEFAK